MKEEMFLRDNSRHSFVCVGAIGKKIISCYILYGNEMKELLQPRYMCFRHQNSRLYKNTRSYQPGVFVVSFFHKSYKLYYIKTLNSKL